MTLDRRGYEVLTFGAGAAEARHDVLAAEEPLEIRVNGRPVSITMRTPGHDAELALGFLHGEGLVRSLAGVGSWRHVGPEANVLDIEVAGPFDPTRLERHFYASSSCGVCGKSSLRALATLAEPVEGTLGVAAAVVRSLPERLAAAQAAYAQTGSLHATGIFTATGDLVCAFEDVGRHNAVDKAVGHCLLGGLGPLDRRIMLVSGRTSFEILQKAVMARIPVVAAISGPSTLAVDLAREFGVTLVGFLRGERFNVYAHPERLTSP